MFVTRHTYKPGKRENWIWRWRRRTAGTRGLPDFYILGAQKCGTASLAEALGRNRGVIRPALKEANYYNRHHDRGELWYRTIFPPQKALAHFGAQTFDASPNYLLYPHCAERMRALTPDARLIVSLRDPVKRAVSEYFHNLRRGYEGRDIETALADRPDFDAVVADTRARNTCLARGAYARQIARYLAHFPRERLLVIGFSELTRAPEATLARITDFLALPRMSGRTLLPDRSTGKRKGAVPPRVIADLEAHFAGEKARVETLIGHEIDW